MIEKRLRLYIFDRVLDGDDVATPSLVDRVD